MKKASQYLLIRALWYLGGFILFYAPFALFQRLIGLILQTETRTTIHGVCFRMAIPALVRGTGLDLLTTSGIAIVLFAVLAFLAGPVFCRRFCLTGALPEYLGRLLPDRFKINWQKHINPTPVRYGFLTAYLLVPLFGLSVCCSYCNFSVTDRLIAAVLNGDLAVMGSTTLITTCVWFFILGVFAKGGRAFCSYFCPVGGVLNLIHSIGARLGFTFKLKFHPEKCIACDVCVKECPMGALQTSAAGLKYNIHNCNTCLQCRHACPSAALSFGTGQSGWKNKPVGKRAETPEGPA